LDEIKKAFRSHFPYNAVKSVWIQGTPITSLPADLFGIIKSQSFYIEVNNITTVDLKVFRQSTKTLGLLSLFGNKLTNFPFGKIVDFDILQTLNLGKNLIETIPDNAFSSNSLSTIIFAKNQIKHIGQNAFAKLPSLIYLEMSLNQMVTLGPMAMSFSSHSSPQQINLSQNKIADVSTSTFSGAYPSKIYFSQNKLTSLKKDVFETLITKVAQQNGFIEVSENPFTCRGCDYSWIALNKDLLATKFIGFKCEDGKSIHNLTKSNIECN